jgi:AcrR family transcriptional regulator
MDSVPFFVDPDDPPSKRALLEAALALFVRDGVREASLRAIAANAGYSNPVLFKFFDGKEALALHLFERCYRRLVADVARALEQPGSFHDRLHGLVQAVVAVYEESPEAMLFVSDELRTFWPKVSARTRRRTAVGLVRAFLEQGVREGVVGRDVGVPMLVIGFWGSIAQFCRASYFKELAGPARDHVPDLERLLVKMLQA